MQVVWVLAALVALVAAAPRNALFIVIDDLRTHLGCYGRTDVKTPNFDRLASKSLLLYNHQCQFSLCNPSRTSLLTGRRPDTTTVWNNEVYWRNTNRNLTTLPQVLKDTYGFDTRSYGKVLHDNTPKHDYPYSWSVPHFTSPNKSFYQQSNFSWVAVTEENEQARPLPDSQTLQQAIADLEKIAQARDSGESIKPFFFAVGFLKPHLPLIAPQRYFDLYPLESVSLPEILTIPEGFPQVAWYKYPGILGYDDIVATGADGSFDTALPIETTRLLRRAYFACISFIDDLLGQLLDQLERTGFAQDTVVSLISDHGWKIGDHKEWLKQSVMEEVARSVGLLHVPGVSDQGLVTQTVTEHVDLLPTVLDVLELPVPALCPVGSPQTPLCTEGVSLKPLLTKPDAAVKKGGFNQFPHNLQGSFMGYSLRTAQLRYNEWVSFNSSKPENPYNWNNIKATELYDLENDPLSSRNVVNDEQYAQQVAELRERLRNGWRSEI